MTCAKSMPYPEEVSVSVEGDDYEAILDAFEKASDQSVHSKDPIYVIF